MFRIMKGVLKRQLAHVAITNDLIKSSFSNIYHSNVTHS